MHKPLPIDWHVQFSHYAQLYVGFSGGLDSTVLLHSLISVPELKQKIIAVHINHGLSPNALDWQTHCQQITKQFAVPCLIHQVQCLQQANIEAAARKARYAVFASLIKENDCLLLAHHGDDQAETLLLQLFRGAGIDGLSAMKVLRNFAQGKLARPFLPFFRQQLEEYANHHHLHWVNDESNDNQQFSRNFIRQELMPLIKSRWPEVTVNLNRTAKHCQQVQQHLLDLAAIDYPDENYKQKTLSLTKLIGLNDERLNNVLRTWFKINEVQQPDTVTLNRLINEVIKASQDATPEVKWKNYRVRRYQQTLYLLDKQQTKPTNVDWLTFPEQIKLPNNLGYVAAAVAAEGIIIPKQNNVEIRFRQGGETFRWHGQTKSLKKLMQQWQIPVWLREQIPLLYINDKLAAVIGYAYSDTHYTKTESPAYQLTVSSEFSGLLDSG